MIVGKDYFIGEFCECYVNCVNSECNKKILVFEENEYKYLCVCLYECWVSFCNCYVKEYGLIEEEFVVCVKELEKEYVIL